jgi:hypothetical protein
MKMINLVILPLMLGFVLAISLASPSSSAEQTVKGNMICVEVDEEGNLQAVDKAECTGLFVVVGDDGKLYTLYGSEEKMKEMAKKAEENKVSGEVGGHQRGWILYASPIAKGQKPAEKTVEGTIVCLIPNYEKATVTPVVAQGPCNELTPHAHVIHTKDGQIYALHGSYEAIQKLEASPEKTNAKITGKLQGNQGAWILFVE